MKKFRVPLQFGFMQWMDEADARKYISSVMDNQTYYRVVRRVMYDEDELTEKLESQKFATLREALTWAVWHPNILEGPNIDALHAICLLAEIDMLVQGDELVDGVVDLPVLWEKLDTRRPSLAL
jgi:hypothetical protein